MSDDLIDLEVQLVHRARGIAILSDGQEIPITNWIGIGGNECDHADAVSCVCGPDFDGKYYAVALGNFVGVLTQ